MHWHVKQEIEPSYQLFIAPDIHNQKGYRATTNLKITHTNYTYNVIFGNFVESEEEAYKKLSDQLHSVDSLINYLKGKY